MKPTPNRGRTAARMIKALHVADGEPNTAASFAAAQNWSDVAPIVGHFKGMVGALTSAEMALSQVGQDFSAAVRPLTLLGRLQGVRKVPMSVRVLTGISGTGAAFVAPGGAIPVSKMDIEGDTLYPLKIGGLSIVSNELLRSSSPTAEDILSEDLTAVCAQAADEAFLDPANVGIADEKPASVTSDVTPLISTGSTFAQIDADLQAMVNQLIAAGSTLVSAAWILRPQTAVHLSSLRDTSGALAYPVTVTGGMLKGLPVLVAGNLPQPGSPVLNQIVLLDASQVVLADEGGAEIEISHQGALQMLDNPTNNSAGTATTMVSLWQTSSAAIRGLLWINWKLRRPYVSVLAGVGF